VVIQQLDNPLRDAICVFYLVLRGLDTVEDDMALSNDVKLPALLSFHEKIYERGFSMNCGYGHYVRLMEQFGTVVDVFLGLDPGFQEVIADITARMGQGMADFIQKEVVSVEDYDLYCHYVSGLVGIGLSQLFASSGLEATSFARSEAMSNHMGLFLQKANIIRDYLEDIQEEPAPRMFWPRDIWGRYAERLEDFQSPAHRTAALHCLNHMVTDALRHLPHCITYMSKLRDPQVFRFCAIPQIMAMGTLSLLYNNGRVFEGVVKLRRGLTARVFDEVYSMSDVFSWYVNFLEQLQAKVEREVAAHDPTLLETVEAVGHCLELCRHGQEKAQAATAASATLSSTERLVDFGLLMVAGAWCYRVFGLGSNLPESALSLGSGVFLEEYPGVEKALAVMLLVAAFARVVMVRL